jgi:kynurenine formamidase
MKFKRRPNGSNWGDFGPEDQIGRMNWLTPEIRLKGLREAKEGIVFTLSLPLDFPGGNAVSQYRKPPKLFVEDRGDGPYYNYKLESLSADIYDVASDDAVLLYTQYSTQWDALCHFGAQFDIDGDGVERPCYYNGYRADSHIVPPGMDGGPFARALGIENLAMAGVQGRGVLVDLERIHHRSRVAVGYDGLMRALDTQKVEVEKGDFFCIYTGWSDVVLEMNKNPDGNALRHELCSVLDGNDPKLLKWIDESGIVAICSDNFGVEDLYRFDPKVNPISGHRHSSAPIHNLCLFKLGIHLAEMWYLTELASWLHSHSRSSFLLTAPPLRLPGAVGSPVTPIATV